MDKQYYREQWDVLGSEVQEAKNILSRPWSISQTELTAWESSIDRLINSLITLKISTTKAVNVTRGT